MFALLCRVGGVYPRVCGGTRYAANATAVIVGLSPRVRGNLPVSLIPLSVVRSIPACAGEPILAGVGTSPPQVYPRVCGGTQREARPRAEGQGLSPRVRGNHAPFDLEYPRAGSIPACAGEPVSGGREVAGRGVYPRVCGGTQILPEDPYGLHGLSPRVRGNLVRTKVMIGPLRSIPACAGEPVRCRRTHGIAAVYPRVCGGTPHHRLKR